MAMRFSIRASRAKHAAIAMPTSTAQNGSARSSKSVRTASMAILPARDANLAASGDAVQP